jgi:hypothetical protein
MLSDLRNKLNGGKIKFYTGVMPLGGNPVTVQVLLGDVILPNPCAPSPSAGQLVLFNPASVPSLAAGIATWARVVDSSDAFLMDCDVTDTTGSGVFKISSTSVTFPGTIDIETIEVFIN